MVVIEPERAVVVIGNLADGFEFVGPFEDFDDASDWADTHCGEAMTWIASMRLPESAGKLIRENKPKIICKFCKKEAIGDESHLHQGQWVGPCCWDERLRSTE